MRTPLACVLMTPLFTLSVSGCSKTDDATTSQPQGASDSTGGSVGEFGGGWGFPSPGGASSTETGGGSFAQFQGGSGGTASTAQAGGGGEWTNGGTPASPCVDENEPNNTRDEATTLKAVTDANKDEQSTSAKLSIDGSNDVDWYVYAGSDDNACCANVTDPTVELISQSQALKVCEFIQCDSGAATNIQCNDGSWEDSALGLNGCCHEANQRFRATKASSLTGICEGGTDDSAHVYIRVTPRHADDTIGCEPYRLTYHF